MDLREYAHTEASAFIDRLLTAAEASADQVRRSAHEQIEALRITADGFRDESIALRQEADSFRQQNHTLTQEIAALSEDTATLRGQIEALETQAASVRTEAEELRGRHAAESARVATLSDQVATLTDQIASLSQELEAETARAAAALQEQGEQYADAQGAHEAVISDLRTELAAAQEQLRALGDAESAQVATLTDQVSRLTDQVAALSQELEAEIARAAAALQEQAEQHADAQAAHDTIIQDLRARLSAAEHARDSAVAQAQPLQARPATADAELAALRQQLDEANTLCDALQDGMAIMRGRRQRVGALTRASIKALDALGTAPAVTDVLQTVLKQLAVEFPRVAVFRVNGKRLQGELAAGFDATIEITKLVIPTSVPSLVTRAAAGSVLEEASSEEIAESRVPLGGSPASALAAPLVFQGEPVAVVYADSDAASNDAHAAFAGLLVAHANVVLSRLTQEMKAAKELRQYAKLLLHEAEEMYLADIAEGRTEADRLRRLHDTIEFGRQLYTQRAELEGASFTGLFDAEIADLVRAEPITVFGSGLAAALPEVARERTAS